MKHLLAILITLSTTHAFAQVCSRGFTQNALTAAEPAVKSFMLERFDAEENQILEIKNIGKVDQRHSVTSSIIFYATAALTSPIWVPITVVEEVHNQLTNTCVMTCETEKNKISAEYLVSYLNEHGASCELEVTYEAIGRIGLRFNSMNSDVVKTSVKSTKLPSCK